MQPSTHGGGLKSIADVPAQDEKTHSAIFSIFDIDGELAKPMRLEANFRNGAVDLHPLDAIPEGRVVTGYSRLAPKAEDSELPSEEDLQELGQLMSELSGRGTKSDMPAAYTYFGQFIAHDITEAHVKQAGNTAVNLRTASLDLDSVVWQPEKLPQEPDISFEAGVAIGHTAPEGGRHDLPRTKDGCPLIPDKRNDSNLALAQFHVAINKFHQRMSSRGTNNDRMATVRCVQAVVLFDYLKRLIDPEVYRDVMQNGRAVVMSTGSKPAERFLVPIEFASACYRFGHSMVRDRYQWSAQEATTQNLLDNTLIGHGLTYGPPRRLSDQWKVDWSKLIPLPGSGTGGHDLAAAIDPHLASTMFRIPSRWFDGQGLPPLVNLAAHTLKAGRRFRIPSAQDLGQHISGKLGGNRPKLELLKANEIADVTSDGLGAFLRADRQPARFVDRTPLWFYTLVEASVVHKGKQLGPLAGRVVMETLHAAVEASGTGLVENNQVNDNALPNGKGFTLADLIQEAENWTAN